MERIAAVLNGAASTFRSLPSVRSKALLFAEKCLVARQQLGASTVSRQERLAPSQTLALHMSSSPAPATDLGDRARLCPWTSAKRAEAADGETGHTEGREESSRPHLSEEKDPCPGARPWWLCLAGAWVS
uniref:Uncharacterized protein n=1 Tax=Molossus molossus TaxID=27622 RepID=A0A7J8FT62_MOLMO|nr:hypothetical protein HJG59_008455 [Molossus molossus]